MINYTYFIKLEEQHKCSKFYTAVFHSQLFALS